MTRLSAPKRYTSADTFLVVCPGSDRVILAMEEYY